MNFSQTFHGLTIIQISIIIGAAGFTYAVSTFNVWVLIVFVFCWVGGHHLLKHICLTQRCLDSSWLSQFIKTVIAIKYYAISTFNRDKDDVDEASAYNFYSLLTREDPPKHPREESNAIQRYMIRDFVISWFSVISTDDSFVQEAEVILQKLSNNVFDRLENIDKYSIAQKYAHLYRCHLKNVQAAKLKLKQQPIVRKKKDPSKAEFKKIKTVLEAFQLLKLFHPAMKDSVNERKYLCMLSRTVFDIILSKELNQCILGKDLVLEILSNKVLHNVVMLIKEPHWLHKNIVRIFSDDKLLIVDPPPAVSDDISHGSIETNSNTSYEDISTAHADLGLRLGVRKSVSEGNEVLKRKDSKNPEEPTGKQDQVGFKQVTSRLLFPSATDGHLPINTTTSPNTPCTSSTPRQQSEIHPETDRPQFFLRESDAISINSASSGSYQSAGLQGRESPDGSSYVPDSAIHVLPLPPNTNNEPFGPGACSALNDHSEPRTLFHDNDHADVDACNESQTVLSSSNVLSSNCHEEDDRQLSWSRLGTESEMQDSLSSDYNENIPQARPYSRLRQDSAIDKVDVDEANDAFTELEGAVHESPGLLFAEVSIAGTESRTETSGLGSGTFTLYTIDTLSWHGTETGSWQIKQQSVKRRYRECLTLHERLEEHPKYRKPVKAIKGPSRWTALPFGNTEAKTVQKRMDFLQQYLKTLASHSEIGNSMALREFLAYDGDGSIAFVKKAHEMPRPDRVIAKTVSGVFKKISEALPGTDEDRPTIERINTRIQNRDKSQSPDLDCSNWSDADKLSLLVQDSDSDTDPDDDMMECVYVRSVTDEDTPISLSTDPIEPDAEFLDALEVKLSPGTPRLEGDGCDKTKLDRVNAMDWQTPLFNTLAELAEQSIIDRDTWVRKDNVIRVFKVLLVRGLEKWIKEEIDDATTSRRCAYYLRMLKDTIWPNGTLDEEVETPPSDHQKEVTKNQAREILYDFFPGFIPLIVGREQFEYSIEEILHSIDQPELNQHFFYCLLDLLIEVLFPEVKTAELQQRLLQSNNHEESDDDVWSQIKLE